MKRKKDGSVDKRTAPRRKPVNAFRTFGGGNDGGGWNPVAYALKDRPPSFAAGVDVEIVVRYIVARVR